MRLGFAVVQTPFHHPVRLAVQLALLDNLSKGRIDVGIGKGTAYNEYEFVGYGLRSTDSRERMEETVDILRARLDASRRSTMRAASTSYMSRRSARSRCSNPARRCGAARSRPARSRNAASSAC